MSLENTHELELKLTIVKLEEELAVLRGTSGSELLTIINEKDREILELQASHEETKEKLRKIAKSSASVLSKVEALERENEELKSARTVSKQETMERENATQNSADMMAKLETMESENHSLKSILDEKDETIVKLQARCAQLVQEKCSQKSEHVKKMKEYKDELERAISCNNQIKQSITEKQADYQAELDKLHGKIRVYEDKIRRQEQFLKSRLLKDRPINTTDTVASKENI